MYVYVYICMYVFIYLFIMSSLRKFNISYKITDSKLWLSCNRLVGILDAFMSRDNTDLSFFVTKCSSTEIFITDLYSL
jgi:hypothetical protein